MAIGTILLPNGAATLADGTAGNAPAGMQYVSGTETAPRKSMLTLAFDRDTNEHAWWTFQLPSTYQRDPVVRLLWMTRDPTAGRACLWGVRLAAVTPLDTDTPLRRPAAAAITVTTAVPGVAYQLASSTLTLGAQTDGAAAGDLVSLLVFRNAASVADTLAADAELVSVTLEYTTT